MTLEQATSAAMEAVDSILANLKVRGRSTQFLTREKHEEMRQEWISQTVAAILKHQRIPGPDLRP